MYPTTVNEILKETHKPVVAIDEDAVITYINAAFQKAYGWTSDELVGQAVTAIMPSHMRDAHNFGFSRFLVAEAPRILNQPLQLPVQCKDGSVMDAEHFILGEQQHNTWRFAATITRNAGD